MHTSSLVNTAVAVTGGAHGIGRAIAERFACAGARVAIGDLDADAAHAAAAAIGTGAIAAGLDVTDAEGFAAFLDAAEQRHGPLGVMINNAGIDWIGPFHQEPDEVSRREIEVNLIGTVIGSRLAVQRMLPRQHGHLVNIASGVGRAPLPGSSVYSATKHAIVGLTESLRLEYRGSGIRFTLVQPAQVETAMIDGQPRPRMLPVVTPEDVACAVLNAVRNDKFDIWVPASQAITFKLSNLLPRPARESLMRAIGIGRIAGEADQAARADYHQRMFGEPKPKHPSQ
jgi:NAD(P)-dependent dehydrogenase (short-subunit alcohol dehydrogenase family)